MAEDHTSTKPSKLNTLGSSDPKEVSSDNKGLCQDEAASNAFQLDPLDKLLLDMDPGALQIDCHGSTNCGKQFEEDAASNAILFQREFDSSLTKELIKTDNDSSSKAAEPLIEKENSSNAKGFKSEVDCASNAKPCDFDDTAFNAVTNDKSPGTNDKPEIDIYQCSVDNISDYMGLSASLGAGGSTPLNKQDEKEVSIFNNADKDMVSMVYKFYENAKSIASKWCTIQMSNTAQEFAAFNNMNRKYNTSHVYCILCFAKIPYALEDMRKHVMSRQHLLIAARTECHNLNSYIHTVMPAREYIPFRIPLIDFVWESRWFRSRQDIVLNKTFCLRSESFHLLRRVSTTHLLCYVCEGTNPFQDLSVHRNVQHNVPHNLSLVLTEFQDEFIREILDRKFHCGFCNLVVPSMRDLQNHMRGVFHLRHKLEAYIRLYKYMPNPAHLDAFTEIEEGRHFVPNWTGRPPPGSH